MSIFLGNTIMKNAFIILFKQCIISLYIRSRKVISFHPEKYILYFISYHVVILRQVIYIRSKVLNLRL